MEKKTITIPNISCGHCVASIQSELNEQEGVNFVGGSPEDKTITVEWEAPATFEAIRDKLKEINYPIQE
jgi:copper chaperone CopZ